MPRGNKGRVTKLRNRWVSSSRPYTFVKTKLGGLTQLYWSHSWYVYALNSLLNLFFRIHFHFHFPFQFFCYHIYAVVHCLLPSTRRASPLLSDHAAPSPRLLHFPLLLLIFSFWVENVIFSLEQDTFPLIRGKDVFYTKNYVIPCFFLLFFVFVSLYLRKWLGLCIEDFEKKTKS